MLPIQWTEEAKTDLFTLITFIAQDNVHAAEAMLQRIEEAILPAAEHPYIFRAGRVAGTREVIAHPNYVVVYRVLTDYIQILNVLHSRQAYPPKPGHG